MKRSETIGKIATALAAAQSEFVDVERDSVSKTPGGREYRYTSLPKLLSAIRPVLSKHGLCLIQGGDGEHVSGHIRMESTLIHTSGEFLSVEFVLPFFATSGKNPAHEAAGAITYYRRYGISSLLMIASEEDDDAAGLSANDKPADTKPTGVRPTGTGTTNAKTSGPVSAAGPSTEPVPKPTKEEVSKSNLQKAMKVVTDSVQKLQGSPTDKQEAIALIKRTVDYAKGLNAKGQILDLHLQQLVDMTKDYVEQES